MDGEWNPNALIVCPYDEVHVVSAQRFQRHLLKCRKNHRDKDTVACPYNATHIVLREKLRSHLGSCPDQRAIDPDITQAQDDETGEVERLMGKVAVPERTCILPSESEDWDLEASNHRKEKGISNTKTHHAGDLNEAKTEKNADKQTKNDHAHVRTDIKLENVDEGLSTYVRMAGRGFNLNYLQNKRPNEKRGLGRGTLCNKR